MKIFLLLIFLLFDVRAIALSKDQPVDIARFFPMYINSIAINADEGCGSFTLPPPFELLLIDPQGRRTGANPKHIGNPKKNFQEIPSSWYYQDMVAHESYDWRFSSVHVSSPIPGEYRILVIGKRTAGYDIDPLFDGRSPDFIPGNSSLGLTQKDLIQEFRIRFPDRSYFRKIFTPQTLRNDVRIAKKLKLIDNKTAKRLLAKTSDPKAFLEELQAGKALFKDRIEETGVDGDCLAILLENDAAGLMNTDNILR